MSGRRCARHVERTLESLLGKYFRTAIEAHAVFAREAHLIAVELSLHVGRGMVVNSRGAATDYYVAFDAAAERLAKQLRRYKRRLRDYHGKARPAGERPEMARSFVLAPVEDVEEELDEAAEAGGEIETAADGGIAPVVIAEMSTELPQSDGRRGGDADGSGRQLGAAVPQPLAWRAECRLSARRRQYRLDRPGEQRGRCQPAVTNRR